MSDGIHNNKRLLERGASLPSTPPSASEPTTHELKVWTRFWSALESGQKNFEVRYNDRDFQAGDTLWLRDYNPYGGGIYSGKECWRTISYVFDGRDCAGLGVEPGYVILGLADERKAEVKPIAEMATFLAKRLNAYDMATAPKDYDPEKQHPSIFRAAADALESQADRIAELAAKVDKQNQIASQEYGMRVAAQERIATLLHENKRIASLESSLLDERSRSERRYEGMMDKDAALQRVRQVCNSSKGEFLLRPSSRPPTVRVSAVESALEGVMPNVRVQPETQRTVPASEYVGEPREGVAAQTTPRVPGSGRDAVLRMDLSENECPTCGAALEGTQQ